jgi:hypothetical protein
MPPEPNIAVSALAIVNKTRLNGRQWALAAAIFACLAWGTPRLWVRLEKFETGPDYRIPYSLSKDYWLYQRRLREIADPRRVTVVGDSVVWGEYVLPDGTWSHFLSRQAGEPGKFVNGGVNGLFPLALEGLVRYYGGALRGRKVLLHCNLLWMSSPKVDLQTDKEEKFNHSRLVPQFSPRIPCYRADASERLGAVVERNAGLLAWVGHLQNAYFEQKSILNWTLADDGNDPAHYPNSHKNPLAQITFVVPAAAAEDPDRGPKSPRHKPWTEGGNKPSSFEWVDSAGSLQWGAFQRLVRILLDRGNQVFVVVGPFNEHLVAEESKAGYQKIHGAVEDWLTSQHVPHWAPQPLPSALYADASHPLTAGYDLLARETWENSAFQAWLKTP